MEILSEATYSSLIMTSGENMKSHDPATEFRRGPHPLSLHIGLAIAEYQRLRSSGGVNDEVMEAMLRGIRAYQTHDFRRIIPKYEKMWHSGQVTLLRHGGKKKSGPRVVLIPSLINRSAILDLLPRRSFMHHLAQQGLNPVLLDWGEPRLDEGLKNCDALINERLIPALQFLHRRSDMPVHALGYCMGGVLLMKALENTPEYVDKIALLGTPWDFHAGDRKMLSHIAAGTPGALQSMAERGYLPQAWIQSVFAAMNADRAAEKFAAFADMDQNSAKTKLFVAVEDWLNDGVDLPSGLAHACINDWYGQNRLALSRTTLPHPAIVVAARKDRLVPYDSARAIQSVFDNPVILSPDTGHIGMMAGSKAEKEVWHPVSTFLSS